MFVTNPIGIVGEDTAAEMLRKQGFRILERNWRLGRLEIDIIAQDKHTIVFAEVKARTSTFGDIKPEEYVDETKKHHMMTAANAYIRYHQLTDHKPRFDIFGVLVHPDTREVVACHQLKDAFLPAMHTIGSGSHQAGWQWRKRTK